MKKIDLDKVVQFDGKELRAGTLLIAKGFDHKHNFILKLIRKYQEDFEELSTLKTKSFKTKGQAGTEFFLTEEQTAFLGALFRNNEQVVQFKKRLIKEFFTMKNALIRLKNQRFDPGYIENRKAGKVVRRDETDFIQELKISGLKAGRSQGWANNLFSCYTSMTNKGLFNVQKGLKKVRDHCDADQIRLIAVVEKIIKDMVHEHLVIGTPHKDIYYIIKDKVIAIGETIGKTDVPPFQIEHNVPKQIGLFNLEPSHLLIL